VAALAAQNILPVPILDLTSIIPSNSVFHNNTTAPFPVPSFPPDDPWTTPSRFPNADGQLPAPGVGTRISNNAFIGTGLPDGWWEKEAVVKITVKGQQGFILNRYTVYEITAMVWHKFTISVPS
jgi:sorting nexin-8